MHARRSGHVVGWLLMLVVAGGGCGGSDVRAEASDREHGIVFISTRGPEGTEVYSMRLDGSGERRLTFNQGIEDQLDVSVDGRWILYTKYDFTARTVPGHLAPGVWPDIRLMDGDGLGSRVLVPYEMGGCFFRDGSDRILLTRTNLAGGTDLHVTTMAGGETVRLLTTGHLNSYVVPSCDGMGILFSSSRDLPDKAGDVSWLSNFEKYAMNIDGSQVRRLTDNVVPDLAANYSPDGATIVLVSGDDLYTMKADGSDRRLVLDGASFDVATFTSDGSRIVFGAKLAQGGSDNEIWSIRVDGTDLRQLTDNDCHDGAPKPW